MIDEITLETFKELEKTQKEFWNVPKESANFLNMLIKSVGAKNALELGTSNGYSGIWLAKALKETGGKLVTIEFWDNRLEEAINNFKKCGVDDIIETKLGSALKILKELKGPFDFVFMDANKLEYLQYFELLDPILSKGAIIAADNVTSHAKKVQPFMERIYSDKNYQCELIPMVGGLLLARKN